MGAAALPYIATAVAAAGTVASVSASNKAANERKNALVQGIDAEAKTQDKANAATNDYVKETYDPTTRSDNYERQATDREQALGSLLAKQSEDGKGDISAATTGAVSDAYTRSKATTTADAAQRAHTLTRLLSRSGATGNLFGQEALAGSDYASDMLGFGVGSRLNSNLTQSRYGTAGSAGNNLALLGGLLSGASGAIGASGRSGGYAGTQAPAPVETRGPF